MRDSISVALTTPDDWHLHLHLRDGAALAAVLPATTRQFRRAIISHSPQPLPA